MAYLLGLDVSTAAAKAVLLDENGRLLVGQGIEYPTNSPRPLWAEQNPRNWWRAAKASIRQLLARAGISGEQVAAIGLTGHMFGMVTLDSAGEPIRPCIMWNDQRSAAQCAEITRRIGAERLVALIANAMIPGFVAPKVVWLRAQEPEAYARIAHLLVAKDYIRYRLTGQYATDVSDSPGTGLFDVAHRHWCQPVLDCLEIPTGWLPRCLESHEISGTITPQAAEETGLSPGTPVVAGAGDQPAQAVGSGVVRAGSISVTIGTSGVIFAAAAQPVMHPQGLLHGCCHAIPDTWCLMGTVMSAGGALRWYRDVIGPTADGSGAARGAGPYDLLAAEAAGAPLGSEGLIFLPYLTGERTPYVDPCARGGWIGLTARHGRSHLVRAVMEGVAFALRDGVEMIEAQCGKALEILVSGGGARSPFWRQVMADVWGRELVTVNETEGAALGAAILAGVGVGVFGSVGAACSDLVHVCTRTQPIPRQAEAYAAFYAVYRDLYRELKSANNRLSSLAQRSGDGDVPSRAASP